MKIQYLKNLIRRSPLEITGLAIFAVVGAIGLCIFICTVCGGDKEENKLSQGAKQIEQAPVGVQPGSKQITPKWMKTYDKGNSSSSPMKSPPRQISASRTAVHNISTSQTPPANTSNAYTDPNGTQSRDLRSRPQRTITDPNKLTEREKTRLKSMERLRERRNP